MTPEEEAEYERLRSAWRHALREDQLRSTRQTGAQEQQAYDALIDYVEDHDLNYSKYDPRPHEEEEGEK